MFEEKRKKIVKKEMFAKCRETIPRGSSGILRRLSCADPFYLLGVLKESDDERGKVAQFLGSAQHPFRLVGDNAVVSVHREAEDVEQSVEVRFGREVESSPDPPAQGVDGEVFHVPDVELVAHVHLVVRPSDYPATNKKQKTNKT